mgnify:CR=1 FL=1
MSTEKLYKIQNDTGWEIYFRPMTPQAVEVISFYQGDPFVNPRKLDTNPAMSKTKSTENVEVMIVEDARECWNLWVEHGDFEVAEVEDFLKGGKEGEDMNHRKSTNTTKSNVTMNGKPCSVKDIAKALKGMSA